MSSLGNQAITVLDDNYTEIKEILDNSTANYATAKQLETDEIGSKSLGKVLSYLVEEEVIGIWENRSGINRYRLTNYDPSDLEEIKEEELE